MNRVYLHGVAHVKKQGDTLFIASEGEGVVDEKSVVATGSDTPRTLADRFGDVVNVRDFGAVGDGVTDDTAAIQVAIEKSGCIYFPKGTYIISETLRIPSNTVLQGAGMGITIIEMSPAAPADYHTITNKQALIEGRYTPNQYTTETRVVDGVTYELRNITVPGSATDDAYDKNIGVFDLTLRNNGDSRQRISKGGSGISWYGVHDVVVSRVESDNACQHGFDTNSMEETTYMFGHKYLAVGQSYNVVFEYTKAVSPVADDGITTHDSHHITIRRHVSINDTTKPSFTYNQNGVEIDDGSSFVLVDNCYARGFVNGFYVQSHKFSPATHDVTVINCHADDCTVATQALCYYDDIPEEDKRERILTRNVNFINCRATNLVSRFPDRYLRPYIGIISGFMNSSIDGMDVVCGDALAIVQLNHGAADCTVSRVRVRNVPKVKGPNDTQAIVYIYDTVGSNNRICDIAVDHALLPVVRVDNIKGSIVVDKISCATADADACGVQLSSNPFNEGDYIYIANVNVPTGVIPIKRGSTSYPTQNLVVAGSLAFLDSNAGQYYGKPILNLYPSSSASICIGVPPTKFITFGDSDGKAYAFIGDSGTSPGADNEFNLGAPSYRWKNVYAASGSISTSDAREKQAIQQCPDGVLDAWGDVEFRQFAFNEAVTKKGADAARLHSGVIAQQVIKAFADRGLDATRYGLLCFDRWPDGYDEVEIVDAPAALDADGNEVAPAQTHMEKRLVTKAGERYGIRYSEALCIEAAYQRRRAQRLEESVSALETRLAAVETLMTNAASKYL